MSTGKFAIPFAGRAITLPGVYTYTDASAMVAPRGVPPRAAVVIDTARGGNVGLATRVPAGFVKALLRGGPGAQLASIMIDRAGLDEVFFVRVNKATASTLDVGDGTITARNPGTASRAIKFTRSAGTLAGSWDLLVQDTSKSFPDERYTSLGPLLTVKYAGEGAAPTLAITVASEVVTFTFGATGDADAAMVITSDNAGNISDLAEQLNSSPSWNANVVGNPAFLTALIPAAVQTFTAGATSVNAGFNAIAVALEGSALVAGTPKAGAARLTNGAEFLADGTDGAAPTVNDWIDALKVCENLPVMSLVVGSGDPAVIAAVQSHVERMSDVVAKRERNAYVGPVLQSTRAGFKAAASAIGQQTNSARVIVAGNEIYDRDIFTGRNTKFPAAMLGAYACARKLRGSPEEPLTEKSVPFQLAYSFEPEDLVDLIEAGVMPAHYDVERGGNIITQGLTSYTRDANVVYRKIAGMDILDYLNKLIRLRLRRFVGGVLDQNLVNLVRAEVAQVLNSETRDGRNPRGVITAGVDRFTGAPRAAWENLKVETDGFDITAVTFECHPVGEAAYIFVTTRFTPVRLVATA